MSLSAPGIFENLELPAGACEPRSVLALAVKPELVLTLKSLHLDYKLKMGTGSLLLVFGNLKILSPVAILVFVAHQSAELYLAGRGPKAIPINRCLTG